MHHYDDQSVIRYPRLGKVVSDLIDHLVGIRIKWLFIHFAFFFLTKFNLKHDVNSGPDSGDSRTD